MGLALASVPLLEVKRMINVRLTKCIEDGG